MVTIISFLLTITGCINWLCIGLLQYDFIAGIFGYQASVFSRIIYIIMGSASIVLLFKLIKNKGTLTIFSRRNKKDLKAQISKIGHKNEKESNLEPNINVEVAKDNPPPSKPQNKEKFQQDSLIDEHFDDIDFDN